MPTNNLPQAIQDWMALSEQQRLAGAAGTPVLNYGGYEWDRPYVDASSISDGGTSGYAPLRQWEQGKHWQNGGYNEYDAAGQSLGYKEFNENPFNLMEALTPFLILAGGVGALGAGAGVAGAAGAGAEGAAAAGAGLGGAGAAAAGFGDAGLMFAGADAAAAGSLGAGTLTGAQVMAGAGGLGAGGAAMGAGSGSLGAGGSAIGNGMASLADLDLMYGGAADLLPGASGVAGSTLGAGTLTGAQVMAGAGGATTAAGGAGGGSGGTTAGTGTLQGVPPPANPALSGAGAASVIPGVSNGQLLGAGSSLLGALSGGQGQSGSTSTSRDLPGYLQGPVVGDLIPRTQGLLNSQMPAAQQAGSQMMSVGSGLLGQTAPTTATNPYLSGVANDMQRRTQEMLQQNNLGIQGNAVASGGLGGSRQGVAQGVAAGKAADYLQGNLANMYGAAYTGDQNRLLQQQTLGAGLLGQGLNTQWAPINQATSTYSPFSGFGTTTQNAQSGGGWQGALGGALAGAATGHQMGWW